MTADLTDLKLIRQREVMNYRLGILSRIIAAVVGGYALATLATLAMAYLLPGEKGPALLTGILLSFLVYGGVIIWVFAWRSVKQVWIGLVALMVPLVLVVLLFNPELAS